MTILTKWQQLKRYVVLFFNRLLFFDNFDALFTFCVSTMSPFSIFQKSFGEKQGTCAAIKVFSKHKVEVHLRENFFLTLNISF